MDDSRDEILANFQAVTGLDDISTCIQLLEQYEWNLATAINNLIPQGHGNYGNGNHGNHMVAPVEETGYESLTRDDVEDERPLEDRDTLLNITVYYNSRPCTISISDRATYQQFQQRIQDMLNIQVSQQNIVGITIPIEDISDETLLCHLNLHECQYKLRLELIQDDVVITKEVVSKEVVTVLDSEDEANNSSPSSQDDEDYGPITEDMFAEDNDDDVIVNKDPLIPSDCTDAAEALLHLTERFSGRYGNVHPMFFVGSLADAVHEAGGGLVANRKPMLIYLHHDKSILSNIFCSQLLCSESIVNYLSHNYIVWAWDLTHDGLKRKLLDMVRDCFGTMVAENVDDIKPDHLPVILIVFKSKGQMNVRNIIQGHTDPDSLLSSLILANEQHHEQAQLDLKEEQERLARESMIKEQEAAFQESLLADREKERVKQEEEQMKLQQEQEERKEEKRKEEERQKLESAIPAEPDSQTRDNVSTLRIKQPDGSQCQRRFLGTNTIRMLLNYIGSKGYPSSDYKVITSYPRKDITELDLELTLSDAGLVPQQTIFVEQR